MMKPSTWALWSGSGGLPSVHRAAAIFWLLGGVMVVAWVVGLVHEVAVWGGSPVLLIAGLSVAVGWCWLAWSTWSTWRADQSPLTLVWTGPVREIQEDGVTLTVGGFRLAQWDSAVRVEVLMDLQRWMLLRVTSLHATAPRQSWIWLDAKVQRPGASAGLTRNSLHHLRSLLYLPARLTTLTQASRAPLSVAMHGMAQAMASWAHTFKSGFKLRSSAMPSGSMHSLSQIHSTTESAFPSTLVMRDDDVCDPLAARTGERA
ncbi:hypothetical protein [Aquabacterium sp.]|uniref:hypothetical protein n=1 Tax=Aquabacterium sp. TaxID=1872578 RepID=UPI002E2EBB5A|nr:hypothetical protein [Aquabacterium sp.]